MTNSPFQIRAGLEGFYGTFYTHPQRNDLIRFLGANGFTHYIYGPKDDRCHRLRWRTPYREADMRQFANTVTVAQEAGIAFAFAISPGGSISYSSPDDFAALCDKLRAFYEAGVRDFCLFLDDIIPTFHSAADEQLYGPVALQTSDGKLRVSAAYATAQADLCNRTYRWLQELDAACTLSMCPTDYAGTAPHSDYLHELGRQLNPAIDVFYTGPQVCSTTITTTDAAAFGAAIQRPPLLWDNYPVNDLGMQFDMHIGPIRGRDADLHSTVRGIAVNLMLQPQASKIALHTFATYFAAPQQYDPQAAWEAALRAVAGAENAAALHLFAENSLRSCLTGRNAEAVTMDRLVEATQADLLQGVRPSRSEAFAALESYLSEIDDACYHLNYYAWSNLALRQELLPWTESLKWRQEMAQYALRLLRTLETGDLSMDGPGSKAERLVQRLKEAIAEVQKRPHRIGGKALLPLARYALEQATAGSPAATLEEVS
jgi:hyaluronoglucosaminidase